MFDMQVFGVSAVGAIMAVVNILKEAGFPTKYVPLVAVGLGIATGVFVLDPHDIAQGVIDGLSLGLSAIGVHSGVKNVREGLMGLVAKVKAAKAAKAAQAQQQQPKQQ